MKTHLLMMKKAVLIWSIFLLYFATSAAGATYYVSTLGSDSYPGTSSQSFRSIQKAADAVEAGDTVIIRDGTYTRADGDGGGGTYHVVFYKGCNGTSDAWITFKAENTHGAIIDGENKYYCFENYRRNFIRFEGIAFTRSAYSTTGIGPGRMIYLNTDATGANGHDIYVYNCKFYNNGRHWQPTECSYDESPGFSPINSKPTTYNVTIDRCLFHDIGRIPMGDCKRDGYDNCIYAQGKGWLIKNNLAYNLWGRFIKIDGYDGLLAGTNNKTYSHVLVNNTVDNSKNQCYVNGTWTSVYGTICIWRSHGANDAIVYIGNNALYANPGPYACIDGQKLTSTSRIEYNVTDAANMVDYAGATTSQKDTGVAFADFNFKDAYNNDYNLTEKSDRLIDSGTGTFAPSEDYSGNLRSSGDRCDIGAYEYIPPEGDLLPSSRKLMLIP